MRGCSRRSCDRDPRSVSAEICTTRRAQCPSVPAPVRAIGFRVAPKTVTYAVVDGTADEATVLVADEIPVPSALWPPNQLHFVRTVLLDVMEEYGVERAGLRLAEGVATPPPARMYLEGVLQELLASSGVTSYFAGNKARIAKFLGFGGDQPRLTGMIEGTISPAWSEGWASYRDEQREAILTAWAAIPRAAEEDSDDDTEPVELVADLASKAGDAE